MNPVKLKIKLCKSFEATKANQFTFISLMSESDENILHSPEVLEPGGCRRSDRDWLNKLWFIREAFKRDKMHKLINN